MRDILIKGTNELSLALDEVQLDKLEKYAQLLKEWNEKINLTAITDDEGIATKHFLDSMTALCTGKVAGKVIDVGTGAGFPGLVLKILKPEIDLYLLDSLNKRLLFLDEVVKELKLEKVTLIHARAEDGGRDKKLREQFDFSVSRAVANLSTLAEYCLPFVKTGGKMVALKGPSLTEEAENAKGALNKLNSEIESINKTIIPDTDMEHMIITIKKLRQMPTQYPRKAGKPSKEPLK